MTTWPTVELHELLLRPLRNGVSPSSRGEFAADVLTLGAVTGRSFQPGALKAGIFDKEPRTDHRVKHSDLLICRGNGNIRLVGRGYFPLQDMPDVVFPDTIIAAEVDQFKVEPNFLEYVWNSPETRKQIESRARTTNGTFKVNQKVLEGIAIPLPPLAEQSRIAEILDRAAALQLKRRLTQEYTDAFIQAIFRDLFGDRHSDWPVEQLGDLAETTSGGTPSRAEDGNYGGLIPWVKSGELHSGFVMGTEENITPTALANSSAKLMPRGTVLLAMYGATAGAVAILGIEAATNQAICCIRPGPKLNRVYLVYQLRSMAESLLGKRVGGAQPNLSQSLVRSLSIPVPPISIQERFAEMVSQIERLKARQARQLKELEGLSASLKLRAFFTDV